MGVPSYFHWLISKFEDEILKGIEKIDPLLRDGTTYNTQLKVNNLYLDLNCAIHPAVKQVGLTRDTMYNAVAKYLEEIISVADPKDLVYIAIDGVSPRAKMSQQRKRRYKSVQDTIL